MKFSCMRLAGFARSLALLGSVLLATSAVAGGSFKEPEDEYKGHPKWNEWVWGNSILSFHGYHRFAYDWHDKGGSDRIVFQAPGAASKYRLGNEADINPEYFLDYKYYLDGLPRKGASPNSRYIGIYGGVNDYRVQGDYSSTRLCADPELEAGCIPQLNITLGNFLGNGVHAWFGRSWYGRRGLDLNDRFYTNPGQGADFGGGIKGIPGFAEGQTLDVAAFYLRDPNIRDGFDGSDVDGFALDLRYYGIKTNKDGQIVLWGKYAHRDGNENVVGSEEDRDGFGVGIFHEQQNVWGGYWNLAALYREGAAEVQGVFNSQIAREADGYDLNSNYSWEINSDLLVQYDPNWALKWIALARKDYRGDGLGETLWLSTGIRPMYFFNDYLNIAWESGLDYVENENIFNDVSGSIWKNTLALGITNKKGYNHRPIARIYGTYAVWDDDLKGQVGGADYANETDGWTFGVQFESWW